MSYNPLHGSINSFLKENELDVAEKKSLIEGELIYANFGKTHSELTKKEVDPEQLNHWHSTAIHHNNGSSVKVSDAYNHYVNWAAARGKNAHTWQDFSKKMSDTGYIKQHFAGHMRYVGIGLNSPTIKEDTINESLLGIAARVAAGTAKGAFKVGKYAYNSYKNKQAQKTKTYHTVFYSHDNGNTWHYHSHHENQAGANKAHENLANFIGDEDKHIAHMHLTTDEINDAKANGNKFLSKYHARLANGGKEPTEKQIKQIDAGPQKPAKISGATSFNAWHKSLLSNKDNHARITGAPNTNAPYNDYFAYARRKDHNIMKEPDFSKHYNKLYPPKSINVSATKPETKVTAVKQQAAKPIKQKTIQ